MAAITLHKYLEDCLVPSFPGLRKTLHINSSFYEGKSAAHIIQALHAFCIVL